MTIESFFLRQHFVQTSSLGMENRAIDEACLAKISPGSPTAIPQLGIIQL